LLESSWFKTYRETIVCMYKKFIWNNNQILLFILVLVPISKLGKIEHSYLHCTQLMYSLLLLFHSKETISIKNRNRFFKISIFFLIF